MLWAWVSGKVAVTGQQRNSVCDPGPQMGKLLTVQVGQGDREVRWPPGEQGHQHETVLRSRQHSDQKDRS